MELHACWGQMRDKQEPDIRAPVTDERPWALVLVFSLSTHSVPNSWAEPGIIREQLQPHTLGQLPKR